MSLISQCFQDGSRPADARSLNFVSGKQVHNVHRIQSGEEYQEDLMSSDMTVDPIHGGKVLILCVKRSLAFCARLRLIVQIILLLSLFQVNEILLPYTIDPFEGANPDSAFTFLEKERQKRVATPDDFKAGRKLRGFTTHRHVAELEKIIDATDDFSSILENQVIFVIISITKMRSFPSNLAHTMSLYFFYLCDDQHYTQ